MILVADRRKWNSTDMVGSVSETRIAFHTLSMAAAALPFSDYYRVHGSRQASVHVDHEG